MFRTFWTGASFRDASSSFIERQPKYDENADCKRSGSPDSRTAMDEDRFTVAQRICAVFGRFQERLNVLRSLIIRYRKLAHFAGRRPRVERIGV